MASQNRHWPSMFKSKPCNNQQWSQHHDVNHHHPSLLSNSCGRPSSTSFSSGCEERSPEPKPRWNPKPEQIRILEAIFNSGMVNPPRDEIRRIRAQLQEYGQVGDANVFYWFQNRKSRSKHKQRSLQAAGKANATAATIAQTASSSSSTSSDKASPKKPKSASNNSSNNTNSSGGSINVVVDQFGNSPTSVNQCTYFHQLVAPPNHNHNHNHHTSDHQFVGQEAMYFPLQQSGVNAVGLPFSQGLGFGGGDVAVTGSDPGGGFSTLLLGEMIGGGGGGAGDQSKRDDVEKLKFQQELSFLVTNPLNTSTSCTISTSSPTIAAPSSGAITGGLGQILGLGDASVMPGKSTVFIDNMAIEVPVGPFNVKEAFGEDALLVHPSGQPVLTNEWGVTLHPLQHGALYYLWRAAVAASPLLDKLDTTPDLLAPSEFTYQI